MQDKRTLSPAEEDGMTDSAILGLMVEANDYRLWSKDELDREMGYDTIDSLNRLYGSGLVHRLDSFIWPTRAAIAADELKL